MMNKKYLYILMAAALVCSCDSEQVVPGNGITEESEDIRFSGTIVSQLDALSTQGCDGEEAGETRSTFSGGAFTSWRVGDKISISDGKTKYYQYAVSEVLSPATSCRFSITAGNQAFEKSSTDDSDYYVFYPSEAVEEWMDGGIVTARIYAEQDYAENTDNDGVMGNYMASKADVTKNEDGSKDVHFSFKHCASVIEVDLSTFSSTTVGNPVAVSIMANNHQALAGRFDYDVNNKSFEVHTSDKTDYATSTQSDVVTVSNVPEGATIVRFYTLPILLDGGLTITVRTSNNEYYTKSISATLGTETTESSISGVSSMSGETTTAKICKPYYQKIKFGAVTDNTKVNDWMATIPSNTYFSKLSTPSAHNAAASSFTSVLGSTATVWSQTQSKAIYSTTTPKVGLVDRYGVRAFDLRTPYRTSEVAGAISGGAIVGSCTPTELATVMPIFHGITQTDYGFIDVVTQLRNYVVAHKTEAITVMFNKEENIANSMGTDNTALMWQTINNLFADLAADIHVGFDEGMTLGKVRGKLIIMNRCPEDSWTEDGNTVNRSGYELCPKASPVYGWGDNPERVEVKFNAPISNVVAIVEDKYDPVGEDSITMCRNKIKYIYPMLAESSANKDPNTYFFIYSAIAATSRLQGLAWSVSSISKSTNYHIITDNRITSESGPTGYFFGDFLGDAGHTGHQLVKTVMAQNTRYVYNGRTRCRHNGSVSTGGTISGGEYADDGPVYIKRK